MKESKFSCWIRWADRDELENLKYPGVYAIAKSTRNLAGKPFTFRKEIIYFGMTNFTGGLRARLNRFDDTISRKRISHGGAERVLFKYPVYEELEPELFVSVSHTKCDVTSKQPKALRLKGKVLQQEYLCFAEFAERFEKMPEFNDFSAKKK